MNLKGKFFMLPNDIFNLELKPAELSVLCYLVRCCDSTTGICYPSIHTIAKACCVSDNTVRKAINLLGERSVISKSGGFSTSKFGKPSNSSYVYSLNSDFYDEDFSRNNLISYLKLQNMKQDTSKF